MATPLPVNPTPAQEYQTNKAACKKLRDYLFDPVLRNALSVSLLQFQRKLANRESLDGNLAAASFMKIQGAQEFVQTLYDLPFPKVDPTQKTDQTKLNYKA